jgi:hypothetical protein
MRWRTQTQFSYDRSARKRPVACIAAAHAKDRVPIARRQISRQSRAAERRFASGNRDRRGPRSRSASTRCVARGLLHRLDGAWWMTLVLASAGLVCVLASGVAIGEATLIAFVIVVLVLARRQFQRRASLLYEPLTAKWLAGVTVVIVISAGLLMFAHEDMQFTRDLRSAGARRSIRSRPRTCRFTLMPA